MFKCQGCGKQVAEGVKVTKRVVETRRHVFPFRSKANRIYREGKVEYRHDNGGVGEQIVKEITLGPCCAEGPSTSTVSSTSTSVTRKGGKK